MEHTSAIAVMAAIVIGYIVVEEGVGSLGVRLLEQLIALMLEPPVVLHVTVALLLVLYSDWPLKLPGGENKGVVLGKFLERWIFIKSMMVSIK